MLIGSGALLFLRALFQLAGGLQAANLAGTDLAALIADLLVTPIWVIGGIQLWRRQPLGHTAGLGLLFQASMLFVALLVFFILQPALAGIPFPLEDFLVVLGMGLVCFISFGFYLQGPLKTR